MDQSPVDGRRNLRQQVNQNKAPKRRKKVDNIRTIETVDWIHFCLKVQASFKRHSNFQAIQFFKLIP